MPSVRRVMKNLPQPTPRTAVLEVLRQYVTCVLFKSRIGVTLILVDQVREIFCPILVKGLDGRIVRVPFAVSSRVLLTALMTLGQIYIRVFEMVFLGLDSTVSFHSNPDPMFSDTNVHIGFSGPPLLPRP